MFGRRSIGVVVLVVVSTLACACVALPPAPSYQYPYDGKVFITYELRDAANNVISHGSGEVERTSRNSTNYKQVESSGFNYLTHDRTEKDLAADGFDGPLGEFEWRRYDKTSSWCTECIPFVENWMWLWLPYVPGEQRQALSFYEADAHVIIQDPVVEPMAECDDGDAEVYRASGPLSPDSTQSGSVTIANC